MREPLFCSTWSSDVTVVRLLFVSLMAYVIRAFSHVLTVTDWFYWAVLGSAFENFGMMINVAFRIL